MEDFPGHPAGRAAGRAPPHPRPPPRDQGHLLAQGVHPSDHALPRPLRLLHLRQAAGPARGLALPGAWRCWRSPGPGRPPACHEALFTLGERPGACPVAQARRPRAGLDRDYLAELPAGPGRDQPAAPRQRRCPARWRAGRAAPGLGQPGDDAGVAVERLGEPGPHARCQTKLPAAGWPPWRRPRLAIRSPPGSWSGSARPGRAAGGAGRHRRRPPPPRPRPGGDRPELRPKPGTAMAAAAPPSLEDYLWTIAAARVLLDPASTSRPRPTSPRTSGPLSEDRRLGRGLPGHRRPRQPGALAGPGAPARGDQALNSPSTPSSPPTPGAGSTPTSTSRCWTAPTPRPWAATTAGRPATPNRPVLVDPGRFPSAAAGAGAGRCGGWWRRAATGRGRAGRPVRGQGPRCGGRGRRRAAPPGRRGRIGHPSSATAASTTPTSAPSAAASAPSPGRPA